ncbi:MAG: hypothetical protein J6A01_06050 [Proteobacteria bacterium]|nr:hypothetical protein [Pseudomonadota bacterium]
MLIHLSFVGWWFGYRASPNTPSLFGYRASPNTPSLFGYRASPNTPHQL